MTTLFTAGYENATLDEFLAELTQAGVSLLVDVRAAARSRRPGFAKSRLAAGLAEAGIGYVHLAGLGTPADGRAAARSGRPEEMKTIFAAHLRGEKAQAELEGLVELLEQQRGVCIMCLEADPADCHRSLVAAAVEERMPVRVVHLRPGSDE